MAGAAMGTVAYMSPEQVRGEEVDPRTDLFSFGVVLYEMATGKQPFQGNTSAVVSHAILSEAPVSPLSLNTKLPLKLDEVINRALERDRDVRCQSAAELRADLKRLKREVDIGRGAAVSAVAIHGQDAHPTAGETPALRRWAAIAGAAVLLLVGAFAAYRYRPSKAPTGPGNATQISRWNKPMYAAKLSPDGRTVAFASLAGGVSQVFVMLAAGGEPLQLTRDEGDKYVDSFSPDGTEIYYGRTAGRDEEWAVPTLGGTPRRLVSGHSLVPSPDGGSFFYLKTNSQAVFRADRLGLEEETLYSFDKPPITPNSILLFPGGNDLLLASGTPSGLHLSKVSIASRSAADLGTVAAWGSDFTWEETGKTFLFSRTVNELTNIWRYNLTDRSLTQVTFGPGRDEPPMPDPGGRGIYYVNGRLSGYLTAYHVRSKQPVDILDEAVTQPIISPNGKRVMYTKLLGPAETLAAGRARPSATEL